MQNSQPPPYEGQCQPQQQCFVQQQPTGGYVLGAQVTIQQPAGGMTGQHGGTMPQQQWPQQQQQQMGQPQMVQQQWPQQQQQMGQPQFIYQQQMGQPQMAVMSQQPQAVMIPQQQQQPQMVMMQQPMMGHDMTLLVQIVQQSMPAGTQDSQGLQALTWLMRDIRKCIQTRFEKWFTDPLVPYPHILDQLEYNLITDCVLTAGACLYVLGFSPNPLSNLTYEDKLFAKAAYLIVLYASGAAIDKDKSKKIVSECGAALADLIRGYTAKLSSKLQNIGKMGELFTMIEVVGLGNLRVSQVSVQMTTAGYAFGPK